MARIKKEKLSRFRLNLGKIGRDDDHVFLEAEFEDAKDNEVKINWWIGTHEHAVMVFVMGYYVVSPKRKYVEDDILHELKMVREHLQFHESLKILYKLIEYLGQVLSE